MAVNRSPVFDIFFQDFKLAIFLEILNSGNLPCLKTFAKNTQNVALSLSDRTTFEASQLAS